MSLAAASVAQNTTSSAPQATLSSKATVIGVSNATTGMETFLGIRYAQPPVGKLRFAAPVPPLTNSSTTINASAYGPVCMQIPDVRPSQIGLKIVADSTHVIKSTFPFALSDMSEDCLTVNVIRPPGLNATSKLPVLVWIYGGSFLNGGNPYPNTEPAIMVGRSMQLVRPTLPSILRSRTSVTLLELVTFLGRAYDIRIVQLPCQFVWLPRVERTRHGSEEWVRCP